MHNGLRAYVCGRTGLSSGVGLCVGVPRQVKAVPFWAVSVCHSCLGASAFVGVCGCVGVCGGGEGGGGGAGAASEQFGNARVPAAMRPFAQAGIAARTVARFGLNPAESRDKLMHSGRADLCRYTWCRPPPSLRPPRVPYRQQARQPRAVDHWLNSG